MFRKPDHFHGLPEHSLAGGSSGLAASGGASTGGVPAGRVDVHSILALLPPSCVVTAFTLRSSRTGVVQLKCVEQQASGEQLNTRHMMRHVMQYAYPCMVGLRVYRHVGKTCSITVWYVGPCEDLLRFTSHA